MKNNIKSKEKYKYIGNRIYRKELKFINVGKLYLYPCDRCNKPTSPKTIGEINRSKKKGHGIYCCFDCQRDPNFDKECRICHINFRSRKYSESRKNRGKYCSRKCYNIWQRSEENIGSNNPNYIDGGKHESYIHSLRKKEPWKLWRKAVYERDKHICQFCGIKGGKLHPHHIKFKKNFPELIFDISNGITLCERCHMQLHRKNMKVENILLHIVKINEAQMMH